MLALPGVPGVYFHSLVGTQNDVDGAQTSGIPRRINRRKFELDELRSILADEDSLQAKIFRGYQRLLEVRTRQPAFHPDGGRELFAHDDPAVLAFERTSCDGAQRILCVTNFSSQPREFNIPHDGHELLSQKPAPAGSTNLEPYQTMWIAY